MTEGLKACPFCGSGHLSLPAEGESGTDERGRSKPYQVRCMSCGATTPSWFERALAMQAWNQRPPAEGG